MTTRELIGLASLVSGTALVPLGWIVSHKILLLAGVLLSIGVWLFYTERMLRKEEQLTKEGSGRGNYESYMPGDIHNYTGWRTGGRNHPLDANSSEGGSDGD